MLELLRSNITRRKDGGCENCFSRMCCHTPIWHLVTMHHVRHRACRQEGKKRDGEAGHTLRAASHTRHQTHEKSPSHAAALGSVKRVVRPWEPMSDRGR